MPVTPPCSVLTISECAARMLEGPPRGAVVHSVFRRAANLLLPPDMLLAITDAAAMRVPNGVVVAGSDDAGGNAFLGLAVGMPAWIGGGCVRIPAAGVGIDAAHAPRWDPRPRFELPPIGPAPFDRNFARLAGLVRECAADQPASFAAVLGLAPRAHGDGADGRHPFLAQRARPAVAALISALAEPKTRTLSRAAERLAGLGYGLTPSGDDFLIGVCGALLLADATLPSVLPSPTPGVSRRDQAAVIATTAARRTTDLSAAWLRHAGRGEFSAEVGRVLVALGNEDAAGFDAAVGRLLAVGGLSGLDTATGVLLGARAVLSSPSERARG